MLSLKAGAITMCEMAGHFAATWGILGVFVLVSQALARLAPLAWDAITGGLSSLQWAVLVVWVVFNAHAEGYRGFHRRFSPRVVARAQVLARDPRPLHFVLAPLFCMSLFHASRRGVIVARSIVVGVTALIIIVRSLDQPWRGIVDAGVVAGLGIGLLSLVYYWVRALTGTPPPIDPDLPARPTPLL